MRIKKYDIDYGRRKMMQSVAYGLGAGVLMPWEKLLAKELDNIQKALLDALVHADVIEDDSLIDALSIQRHEAKDEGEVIVRIEPYAKEMQDLRV